MTRLTKALCIGLAMIGTGLRAQDTSGHLSVELNAAQDQEGACKLSFLVQNSHAADVEKQTANVIGQRHAHRVLE